MSEPLPHPRRILLLLIEGLSAERLDEMVQSSPQTADATEIFSLTKDTAREALELIFASDTVAVWGRI